MRVRVPEYEQLRERAEPIKRKVNTVDLLILLASLAAFGILVPKALLASQEAVLQRVFAREQVIILPTTWNTVALPLLFLGLCVVNFKVSSWLKKRILNEEECRTLESYTRFKRLWLPKGLSQIGPVCQAAVAVVCILFLAIALDSYTIIGEDAMTVDPYLSLKAKRYKWDQVTELCTYWDETPGRNRCPGFLLTFRDGTVWRTHDWLPYDRSGARAREIIRSIAARSGADVTAR